MKAKELFFDGRLSNYFTGYPNLYIGDHDFKFANDYYVINAEIKTISKDGKYNNTPMSALQAREYAATAGLIDPLGRKHSNYLFEYHKYAKKPFVIVVPFKTARGNEKCAIDYLNIEAARMMYIDDENQFVKLFQKFDLDKIGVTPKKPLLCVSPF